MRRKFESLETRGKREGGQVYYLFLERNVDGPQFEDIQQGELFRQVEARNFPWRPGARHVVDDVGIRFCNGHVVDDVGIRFCDRHVVFHRGIRRQS